LDGAVFVLEDPTTGESWTVTTGDDGQGIAIVGRGQYGNFLYPWRTYILREIQSPNGYILDNTPREIVLSPGNENSITIANQPYTYLEILKIDETTGLPLDGAIFVLRDPTTGEEWRTQPTVTGITTIGRDGHLNGEPFLIPNRTYVLIEIQSPNGYVLNSTPLDVVLTNRGRNEVVIRNTPLQFLQVTKVDGNDVTNLLDDAIFQLRDPITGQTWQATTENGIAILGRDTNGVNQLIPGRTYILTEIQAPNGFVLISEPIEIVINVQPPNQPHVITVRNYENPTLTIIKRDQDTQEYLPGAVFEIEFENGQSIPGNPFTTDINGRIVLPWTLFEGNTERTIRITETIPPPGYSLSNPNWQLVTMRMGEHNTVIFENRRNPDWLITKRDEITGRGIPNTEFTIERLSQPNAGMLTNNPFRTDSNGQIDLSSLAPGIYRLVETRAANGYWLDPNEANRTWVIELKPNEDYHLVIHNTMLPSLIITKFNHLTNRPIPNTHFRVEFEVPGTGQIRLIGNFVTNQNGQIVLPFVQSGWYIITETRPAQGMQMPTNNVRRVFLAPGDNTYTILGPTSPNFPQPPFTVPPISPVESPMGTVDNPHQTPNVEVNINPESDLSEEGLLLGTTPVNLNFTISDGNNFNTGEGIWNFPLNSIVIRKSSATTGQMLQGAVFQVRKVTENISGQSGTIIGTFTTPMSGIIVITGLEPGGYIIEEISPPAGYLLADNNRIQIWLKYDGTSIEEARFENHPYGGILISKRNSVTGEPLPGATFRVQNSQGAVVGTGNGLFTTNSQGEVFIPQVPPGSYVVTEVTAPDGFILDSTPQTIHVTATGQIFRLEFTNTPESSITIRKISGETNLPQAGVVFEITRVGGGRVQNPLDGGFEFITGADGLVTLPQLESGTFIATETRPLQGYGIAEPQTFTVTAGQNVTLTFRNYRLPGLTIRKISGETNQPQAGVVFEIANVNGERFRNPANGSYEFITGNDGLITIPNIPNGTFIATEVRPLDGYGVAPPQTFTIDGSNVTLTFRNYRLPSLTIRKVSGDTELPQSGVAFEVHHLNGGRVQNPTDNSFEFITNNLGLITIPHIGNGTFVITETRPLAGYGIAEPQTVVIDGESVTVTFRNYKLNSVVIRKIDYDTGQPLPGVVFEIKRYFLNGRTGENLKNYAHDNSYEFTTDQSGHIYLPAIPDGTWIAIETRPLPGYMNDDPNTIFRTGVNGDTTIIIRNRRYPEASILKLDGDTQRPLAGVHFEIAHDLGNGNAGERVINPSTNTTTFVTDSAGRINLPVGLIGRFIAIETRPLQGYQVAEPTLFNIVEGQNQTITINNYRYGEVVIEKRDGDTLEPLEGVHFEIAHDVGGGRAGELVVNPYNNTTTFVTNNLGRIHLPTGLSGRFIAIETRALDGYVLAEPTLFDITDGEARVIVIHNYRVAELTIRKINSITREPLEGVHFEISRPNGTRVINPQTGFYTFITDRNGLIYLPSIEDGEYILHETRALPGFIVDHEQIRFTIDADGRQRTNILEVENRPASGLLIIKTDEDGNPLAGVEFEIRTPDGTLVRPQILAGNQPDTPANSPQLTANGGLVTDSRGRIELNHIEPGVYHIAETRALPGFELDSTTHLVTVLAGRQEVLTVVNRALGGIFLEKINAFTGEGIWNVEFMVFDSNNQVVGTFYTDNNGIIDFSNILLEGRYTIRETRPAPGFFRDDVPRTIEIRPGQVTRITWENIPYAGQLQIQKVSGDDNQMNGLPAGTPLEGAIFEIFEFRSGNLVDRIISDHNGMAVSRPLPLGRYFAREVQAPSFYMINPQEIHFDIEFATQIVRVQFPNFSANTGVSINKTGPAEVIQGQEIQYNINRVRNESSIPLTDFFWRDLIPTEAIRVHQLVTGTFNHEVRMRITGTTNTGREIVIADQLSSIRNHVVELNPAALGLASNEFLVDFTVHFGQVPAGFREVEAPKVIGQVLNTNQANLPNGMIFANRVDVGGRTGGEWVIGNSTWTTTIFRPTTPGRIPQSGF